MTKGSLPLHPKHGVNATIPTCFWCGKSRAEIVMLGAKFKGEAPMHMVIDYNPCDECKAAQAKGITIVEVADAKMLGRPPLHKRGDKAPTGRWVVVTEDGIRGAMTAEWAERAIAARGLTVERDAWEMLNLPSNQEKITGESETS